MRRRKRRRRRQIKVEFRVSYKSSHSLLRSRDIPDSPNEPSSGRSTGKFYCVAVAVGVGSAGSRRHTFLERHETLGGRTVYSTLFPRLPLPVIECETRRESSGGTTGARNLEIYADCSCVCVCVRACVCVCVCARARARERTRQSGKRKRVLDVFSRNFYPRSLNETSTKLSRHNLAGAIKSEQFYGSFFSAYLALRACLLMTIRCCVAA